MDWQSVQPFFNWLAEHPALAGIVVLLIALTESLVIVGLIVPGAVLMFGVGTLVGAGVLGFQETVILAFLGAVLGDGISFWVGKYYRDPLVRSWPFNKRPDYLELGQSFFLKHGGKSIFFGRFVGPVRPIIPAVAGMMGMSTRTFLFMNVLSAMLWAPFYLFPGIVFGKSIALAEVVGGRLVAILIIAVVVIVLMFWFIRKLMLFILPRAESVFTLVYQWASHHPLLGRAVLLIYGDKMSMRRAMSISSALILLALLSLYLFVLQVFQPAQLGIDEFAVNFISLIQSSELNKFFYPVNAFFSLSVLLVTLVGLLVVLTLLKEFLLLRYFMFAVLASVIGSSTLFLLVHAEPEQLYNTIELAVIASLFGCLVIAVFAKFGFAMRSAAYSIFVLMLLLPMAGLIYLAQTLPSVAVMVVATSLVWVSFSSLLHQQVLFNFKQQKIFTMLVIGIFVLSGFVQTSLLTVPTEGSQAKAMEKQITFEQWQADRWQQLSSHRIDIFGDAKQPFNVQWSGNLSSFESQLSQLGWQKPTDLTTQASMYYLKPEPTFAELPLLPQSHNGKKEMLVMVQSGDAPDEQTVLRLWKSGYVVSDTGESIWIGAMTHRRLSIQREWIRFPQIEVRPAGDVAKIIPKKTKWFVARKSGVTNNEVFLLSEATVSPSKTGEDDEK